MRKKHHQPELFEEEKKPKVWLLKAGSLGEQRAREGIAQLINPDYEVIDLQEMNKEEIRTFCQEKLDTNQLKRSDKWPDFVVASGKRSTKAAVALKELSGGKVFVINSQAPRDHLDQFDLIAAPSHLVKDEERRMKNVMPVLGVPHAVTPEKIAEGVESWKDEFSHLPGPKIAVLLGGKIRKKKHDDGTVESFDFSPELARKMARELNAKAKELGASLIVTTSPRTGEAATQAFADEITVPAYIHDWSQTAARGNPYFGILGLADAVVVTGDSMSMCCEANMSGKPVYIYSPRNEDGKEHFRKGHVNLHKQLYDANLAKPFESLIENGIENGEGYTPLDTTQQIAREALTRWHEKQQQRSL